MISQLYLYIVLQQTLKQMEKEVTLTVSQLREIFIAGGEFEKQNIEFDLDEREEIDAPDFGELMKEFGIEI